MKTHLPRSNQPFWRTLACGVGVLGAAWAASAQAQGIYSCIDAKGRRITSDRPIVECLDREQELRGKTGTVREVLPPSYTREERARLEEKARALGVHERGPFLGELPVDDAHDADLGDAIAGRGGPGGLQVHEGDRGGEHEREF